MRRWLFGTALGLGLATLAGLAQAAAPDKQKAEGTCGSFGTTVEFVDTPSAAAAQAKKEQKLVFVLHVSGNFEDPRFT
ncbi:MAG TPA: hypothetical protein VFE78_04320 [Gemmataceae bacterium]|jgi:hypothetical protein|nr:hypothetical protein [Gemmataceae bacterium]